MTSWVALLRGINVGGVSIRSADLAELVRGLGHQHVRTVLATGNVVFEIDGSLGGGESLKTELEQALGARFGYDAWIVLMTLDELRTAVEAYPFDAADAERQPYVVFCSDTTARTSLLSLSATLDPLEDPIDGGPGVVYWSPEKGRTLDTPFGTALARPAMRTTTTTRNLRTLQKILASAP